MNTLVDKYSEKGDVGTHNKPYLNYLNEDVAKSTTKMIETLGKYNHTYKDWVCISILKSYLARC